VAINMAKRLSSQHFTVISSFVALGHEQIEGQAFWALRGSGRPSFFGAPIRNTCGGALEGNVIEGSSISVVTVANRRCEIESRSTIAP
jgi:hypothetical protein